MISRRLPKVGHPVEDQRVPPSLPVRHFLQLSHLSYYQVFLLHGSEKAISLTVNSNVLSFSLGNSFLGGGRLERLIFKLNGLFSLNPSIRIEASVRYSLIIFPKTSESSGREAAIICPSIRNNKSPGLIPPSLQVYLDKLE